MTLDIRVLELLVSRICHDLVSPVGAVGNGVELLQDMGADGIEDSLPLLEHSAKLASARLQIFRLAYGAGGSEAMVSGKQVYETYKNFLAAEGKVTMQWDLMLECPMDPKTGFFKVLTNVLMLAREALPRGGVVSVLFPEGASSVKVEAAGDHAQLKDSVVQALSGETAIEELDPKTTGPYVAGVFARHFGVDVKATIEEQKVTFELSGF